jgi:hypothetical protein
MPILEADKPYASQVSAHLLTTVIRVKEIEQDLIRLAIARRHCGVGGKTIKLEWDE